MDYGIENKNALIFASSKGLGLGIAKNLAREGCNVALCSRSMSHLEKAKNVILDENQEINVILKTTDLAKREEVEELLDWTLTSYNGKLDILITNTGGPPTKKFLETSLKEWNHEYNSILLSVIIALQKAIPDMLKRKWGRIITLSSLTVQQPLENFSFSNTYRAGIAALVKTIALEHSSSETDFTINNVCPGYTRTDRVTDIVESRSQQENVSKDMIIEKMVQNIPKKRMATVEELANLVTFLVSQKSSYITGKSISIDGGFVKGSLL